MKKLIFIFAILFSINVKSQGIEDSTITIQAPRVFGWYIAKGILQGFNQKNYRMLDVLKPYVADSTKPDSLFTVSLKVKYVKDAVEMLLAAQCEVVFLDRLKIMNNQRVAATAAAISGYTGLESQIITKANGNTSEKDEAVYLRDWYVERRNNFAALWRENRNDVINAVNQ